MRLLPVLLIVCATLARRLPKSRRRSWNLRFDGLKEAAHRPGEGQIGQP
jgi:hypothetical protein